MSGGGTHFTSAAEMAKHLSEYVTDEDFIDRAVRTAFPQWKREVRASWRMGHTEFRACSRAKPQSLDDGWMASELADKLYHKDMRQGSRKLLSALWERHQRIMLVHEAYGRKVERP